ncbi:MAG: TIGR00282 family metallophosphoesterase [Alphaproteobacteria bacterium]|nr:TIGR00282 family metallophosphoesterase [Alphaproteobacteria bacterium]
MRILFFGDVMGRSGREGLAQHLPMLKERLKPDAVIANAENAASGVGLTKKVADDLFALGISCLTLGNHSWAQRELMISIESEPRIIRPLNYPEGTPGRGVYMIDVSQGRKLLVVNPLMRVFVEPLLDDPFGAMEKTVAEHKLSGNLQILVDAHGEATSEKSALANVLDGRVSAVVGTHTHVPTADERILPQGSAYISDVGMCGDYDSIVGMKKDVATWRFTHKTPFRERKSPAEGAATVCGVLITTDDSTGLAVNIEPIRIGGILKQEIPSAI